MKWAIDLDDVTVDFVPGMLESYAIEFGEEYLALHGTWGQEMVDFFAIGTPKLNAAGYPDGWAWLRDRDWLWALFPAVDGAIGGISTLRNWGHWVEGITSKPQWARHLVWKWCGKWRADFDQLTLINSLDGQRKVDYTNADVIVDDKLSTCLEFTQAGRQAILFGPSGFEDVPKRRGLHIASDWNQVLDIAHQLTVLAQKGALVCSSV